MLAAVGRIRDISSQPVGVRVNAAIRRLLTKDGGDVVGGTLVEVRSGVLAVPGRVRGDHCVGSADKRVVFWRFCFQYVEACSLDPIRLERFEQRVCVDDGTPADVNDDRLRAQPVEGVGVDHSSR